jgi:AbrB family looped-hinge helix DNA binding protein
VGTEADDETVTVDGRGRITLPKPVRDRLHLGEDDELVVVVDEGEIHLRPERESFEPINSGKRQWGAEAFLDAGTAMVGEPEDEQTDGR